MTDNKPILDSAIEHELAAFLEWTKILFPYLGGGPTRHSVEVLRDMWVDARRSAGDTSKLTTVSEEELEHRYVIFHNRLN